MTEVTPGSPLDRVARWYEERTGTPLTLFPAEVLRDRVASAMAKAGIRDLAILLERLQREPRLLDVLVSELTIPETYFFRDPQHFDFIRDEIFPGLVDGSGKARPLRAWSAGCSTGEEIYSLAMLLDMHGRLAGSSLLATDLNLDSLQAARRACYRPWSLRLGHSFPAETYLTPVGSLHQVSDRIRHAIRLEPFNLVAPGFPATLDDPPRLDLILCRNVLIYFNPASVARVAEKLHAALAPGGWLIAGPSDPPLHPHCPLELRTTPHGIFYRKPDDRPVELRRDPGHILPPAIPARQRAPGPRAPAASSPRATVRTPPRARQALAEGQYVEALGLARQAGPSAEAAVIEVSARVALEGPRQALERAVPLIADHPGSSELRYLIATLKLGLGDPAGATGELETLLRRDHGVVAAMVMLAELLQRAGSHERAIREYRNALQILVDSPADDPVPLTEGESVSSMTRQVQRRIGELVKRGGRS